MVHSNLRNKGNFWEKKNATPAGKIPSKLVSTLSTVTSTGSVHSSKESQEHAGTCSEIQDSSPVRVELFDYL